MWGIGYCSVAKWSSALCDPMDCSTPGFPYPSPSCGVCSNSCSLSWWCHPTISPSVAPVSSCLQFFPVLGVFSSMLALHIRWLKYWSIQHQSLDWIFRFDFLAVQGILKSSPALQFESISSLVLSLLYGSTLTSVNDYWKNHNFDYTDLCWQSDVSDF